MQERRRFVRLDARVEVDCTILPTGTPQRLVSRDLSGGGIRLFTEQAIPLGTSLQLAIRLPDREEPINATAQVVSSEETQMTGAAERSRSIEIGTRCVEISPADYEALSRFVSDRLRPAISS